MKNRRTKNRIKFALGCMIVGSTLSVYLSSCGTKNCSMLDHAFREPSCRNLSLSIGVIPIAPASCAGAPSSRNLTINCPSTTGVNNNCKAAADGFTVYVILVPNNANGNFTDMNGTGTTYTSCNQLLSDVQNDLVADILGIYVSDNSPGNRLDCNDTTGCTLSNSAGCFSAWDSVNKTVKGTASIPANTNALACAYIDNSATSTPSNPIPPASYGTWAGPLVPFNNITGTLNFSNPTPSSWSDAY